MNAPVTLFWRAAQGKKLKKKCSFVHWTYKLQVTIDNYSSGPKWIHFLERRKMTLFHREGGPSKDKGGFREKEKHNLNLFRNI